MFYNYFLDPLTNQISFETKDIDLSILNAIRRVLLMDIPILGFNGSGIDTSINIVENTSVLNNEIISNRIALIPLNIDESYNDNFDPNINKLEITLDVSCNENDNMKLITTEHLIVKKDEKVIKNFFSKNKISNEYILITKLRKNEKITLDAYAVKETGRKNASFSIVSGLTVYNKPMDNKDITDILEKERNYIENEFVFKFEIINNSFSHYYLLNKAISILIQKITILNDKVTLQQYKDYENTYDYVIPDENDTIGNLVQSYIFDTYVLTKTKINEESYCSYVGYVVKHPLERKLNIRVTIENTSDINIFKDFMKIVCNKIINEQLQVIQKNLETFFTNNKVND